jgi:hypothetical protein
MRTKKLIKLIMKTYEIEITEVLQKIIIVKAQNQNDAFEIVKKKYDTEEIVLSYNDYADTEIKIVNNK